MNLRQAKKRIKNDIAIMQWIYLINNSKNALNNILKIKDWTNNDLYKHTYTLLINYIQFEYFHGYNIAKHYNIKSKQYYKIIEKFK